MKVLNNPKNIVLHHSLTKDGKTVSWGTIRDYHKKVLGWDDIGYHFGIELVDEHYEILMGRMISEIGAHCPRESMNRNSIGICLIGNFDLIEPSIFIWTLGLKLVRQLMTSFGINLTHIHGHREFANYKTCPGKHFDLDLFRRELI